MHERLGILIRKAWALLEVERARTGAVAFARSYEEGLLPWARALMLLPVVDHDNAEAWITRAATVTARRLTDEVDWVLEARDALGVHVPLDPPPLDSDLSSAVAHMLARECRKTSPAAALQIGAHAATAADRDRRALSEVCNVEIQFTAPASVVALLRDTLDAFAPPGEPRWTGLERVLRHVLVYWDGSPRHRDPVFARDGWRCAVPACNSRRNLHDHHIRYRSRGGGNERENRVTICASHHLHGVHRGAIRTWGTAPRGVYWQLGVRPGIPPLRSYVGDRICKESASDTDQITASAGS